MMKIGELVWVVVTSSGRGQEVFVDLRLGRAKLWINYLRAAAWRGVGEPPRCAQGQSDILYFTCR